MNWWNYDGKPIAIDVSRNSQEENHPCLKRDKLCWYSRKSFYFLFITIGMGELLFPLEAVATRVYEPLTCLEFNG